jgi:hypothetical protein
MDSTVKSLIITGSAAEDATRSRQKKASTRKQRQIVKEEDDELVEQAKQLAKTQLQTKLQQPQQKPIINLESKVVQPQVQPQVKPQVKPQIQPQVQPQVQPQIQAQIKTVGSNVILNPPKIQRVKLQPKIQQQTKEESLNTTRKARRIHLSTANLSHRFTRAKRLKEDTEKKPVSSIREYLVSKGVIQQKSKAPEKMLRSMYSDFMLLKDQAL